VNAVSTRWAIDGLASATHTNPVQKRFSTPGVGLEENGADAARTGGAAERPRRGEPGPEFGGVDQNVHDALTDLSAYALSLDVERHRVDDRLLELAEIESSVAERRALLRERDAIAEELTALRQTIAAFSDQVRR
jgi:hypothetical protein